MFKENYVIQGKIVCKTGLHIGGSSDAIDIGGSDNVIIRDSVSGNPYIPGSSLKGKLRFLTELNDKASAESVVRNRGGVADDKSCIAAKLFGVSAEEGQTELKFPTRTIVRDAYPDEDTIELWDNEALISGAELKYENSINRINSAANPRNIERVPKGSKFDFEIIFSVYDDDDENISYLLDAMRLLEDNYLGGSGSRGFGQIKFENIKISKRTADYYKQATEEEIIIESDEITEVINAFK
jgi:CRISPR-associated protein Csm3